MHSLYNVQLHDALHMTDMDQDIEPYQPAYRTPLLRLVVNKLFGLALRYLRTPRQSQIDPVTTPLTTVAKH